MNNKGVTLVELLIVIVVLGIISAFAIPAVGSIIDNTRAGSVYNDALQVENAAKLYCTENPEDAACDGTGTLEWSDLSGYIEGFPNNDYEETRDTTPTTGLADFSSGEWVISLEAVGNAAGDFEWVDTTGAPSTVGKGGVTEDN